MTKYTLESSREWYNNLPGKRASAAMIVRYDNKVLMIKDDYKSAMTFPGGIVDPDESAKTAAIRETMEEVGLVLLPEDVSFYSIAYIQKNNGFNDRFHFFFVVDAKSADEAQFTMGKGIERHEWVAYENISERAGGRSSYAELQRMLVEGKVSPYIEV